MRAKIILVAVFICVFGISTICGSESRNDVVDFISSVYSPRQFTSGAISDEVIEQILFAGHKAPSARNLQPWHFTVVRNKVVIDQILQNVNDGEVLIVLSCPPLEQNHFGEFDNGLAMQNMFLTTQSLGLGARIYGIPVPRINETMKDTLGIPEHLRAIMVLRIGHLAPGLDATTGASPRANIEDKVNYVN